MNERRKILEDANGYLIEKLQQVPNMARLKMGLTGRFILGEDTVKNIEKIGGEKNGNVQEIS